MKSHPSQKQALTAYYSRNHPKARARGHSFCVIKDEEFVPEMVDALPEGDDKQVEPNKVVRELGSGSNRNARSFISIATTKAEAKRIVVIAPNTPLNLTVAEHLKQLKLEQASRTQDANVPVLTDQRLAVEAKFLFDLQSEKAKINSNEHAANDVRIFKIAHPEIADLAEYFPPSDTKDGWRETLPFLGEYKLGEELWHLGVEASAVPEAVSEALVKIFYYLAQASEELGRLKAKNIVHHDAHFNNFMLSANGIRAFDFDMSRLSEEPFAGDLSFFLRQMIPHWAPELRESSLKTKSHFNQDVYSFAFCTLRGRDGDHKLGPWVAPIESRLTYLREQKNSTTLHELLETALMEKPGQRLVIIETLYVQWMCEFVILAEEFVMQTTDKEKKNLWINQALYWSNYTLEQFNDVNAESTPFDPMNTSFILDGIKKLREKNAELQELLEQLNPAEVDGKSATAAAANGPVKLNRVFVLDGSNVITILHQGDPEYATQYQYWQQNFQSTARSQEVLFVLPNTGAQEKEISITVYVKNFQKPTIVDQYAFSVKKTEFTAIKRWDAGYFNSMVPATQKECAEDLCMVCFQLIQERIDAKAQAPVPAQAAQSSRAHAPAPPPAVRAEMKAQASAPRAAAAGVAYANQTVPHRAAASAVALKTDSVQEAQKKRETFKQGILKILRKVADDNYDVFCGDSISVELQDLFDELRAARNNDAYINVISTWHAAKKINFETARELLLLVPSKKYPQVIEKNFMELDQEKILGLVAAKKITLEYGLMLLKSLPELLVGKEITTQQLQETINTYDTEAGWFRKKTTGRTQTMQDLAILLAWSARVTLTAIPLKFFNFIFALSNQRSKLLRQGVVDNRCGLFDGKTKVAIPETMSSTEKAIVRLREVANLNIILT